MCHEAPVPGFVGGIEICFKAPENRPVLHLIRDNTSYVHTKGFTAFNPLRRRKSILQMKKRGYRRSVTSQQAQELGCEPKQGVS